MKKIVVLITIIGLLVFFSSCEKQRLPEGEYEVTVTIEADNTTFNPKYASSIIESNKNYLIIQNAFSGRDSDTLYRDGNNVTGVLFWRGAPLNLGNFGRFDNFNISGTISKEKGVYYLKGTLTTLYITPNPYTETIDTFDATGTFEFKSIF